ncbi:TPA_asm: hypothetical protein GYO74_14080 [Listeria monocytogenes]|uniref:hypothetical protein n=1 Tax=Listeria monocytogenes TaxID=1639 RepID=UPI0001C2F34D|nr:hypothetical protein [Listeria monocytogenes]ADB68631.1 hypothetical protein LM5578_1883 [Listeria monocytogenes 08-5578]ADB71676.1 hypothetical protein LM5923_1835 [Listeria monocytogenes 08-5923]AHF32547.1 hypothetical protein A430_1893 [Listeria monocytogenes serotype 1/2a str. 08-6569]AHF35538.1 hypothetical protein A431_1893 [Listeria monocytogenes serotype 1/2a str. 08-6997]AHF38529.1 hypothetical protein A435_1893 [Listeria monocytogenes serotype 1/2a str. 10-0815]
MKRLCSVLLVLTLLFTSLCSTTAYAVGDGNVDNGGGGMGQGTSTDKWSPGNEGVRVTVVRASDHAVVTTPIDLTNKSPSDIRLHFGKVSKLSYTGGRGVSPSGSKYSYVNPAQALPTIISSGSGNANIEAIKSYFTDEQVIRSIAGMTGMDFDTLVGGDYKLLIEPIAYITFQGVKVAMTATESALYDEQVGGLLRSKMVSLSHKNLPLAMFLEVADLGYPAWGGSRTSAASDADIKSSLGLGVVRFKDMPTEPPEVSTDNYKYRVNTEVITSVMVSGGQSDPDNPVTVTFNIGGRSYRVSNVYYPSGDSQIAWVRWTTPSTPQTMTIQVSVSGGGSTSQGVITAKIVDLDQNEPPNPVADDRNDSYTKPSVPSNAQVTSSSWGVWRPWWHAYWVWHSTGDDDGYWCDHGWWEFDFDRYHASLSASMSIKPDDKNPTASGKTMKSGYGINQTVTANVSTNQSSAVTGAQNSVTYFPEFQYKSFWRLLDRSGSSYSPTFEFKKNEYSTYNRRTHFTPIWIPDGIYTPYTWLIDCWTPTGMLSMNLTDSVTISGNLWTDWHISPQNPN